MRDAAAEALGVEPRTVAVAETGTIGVPLDDRGRRRRGPRGGRTASRANGGEDFAQAIMTTDRGPKRCTIRAGEVTVSAQAKGAGMIEPGFATMLCFVQTDAVIDDPDAALRSALAGLDGADHRRRPDEHQRHRPAAGDRRRPGAALPRGLLEAVLLQLALEIVADGEGATRVGRVEVTGAARRGGGRAGGAGDRQLAAGQDGALRTGLQLGPDRPGRRDGAGGRGARGARARTGSRPRSSPPSCPRPSSPSISAAARPAPTSTSAT